MKKISFICFFFSFISIINANEIKLNTKNRNEIKKEFLKLHKEKNIYSASIKYYKNHTIITYYEKAKTVFDIPQMIYENLYLQYEDNEKVLQEYNNNVEYYNLLFKNSE